MALGATSQEVAITSLPAFSSFVRTLSAACMYFCAVRIWKRGRSMRSLKIVSNSPLFVWFFSAISSSPIVTAPAANTVCTFSMLSRCERITFTRASGVSSCTGTLPCSRFTRPRSGFTISACTFSTLFFCFMVCVSSLLNGRPAGRPY